MERFSTPAGMLAVATSAASALVAGDHVVVARCYSFTLERARLGRTGSLLGYSSGSGYAIVKFDDEELSLEEVLVHPECLDRKETT